MFEILKQSEEIRKKLDLSSIVVVMDQALYAKAAEIDKVNYPQYLTPYFAQMTNLGDKNPEVQKAFKEGSASVQLANSNRFGRIPVDPNN